MPTALRSHGWSEGENLVVERRYAGGDLQRLPALAAELVALKVDNWSWPATESAARTFGLTLRPYSPTTLNEIEAALRDAERQTDGVVFFDCPYFNGLEPAVLLRHALPAMHPFESYAHYGGLMAYGYDEILLQARQAWYIDRILRGVKPADLPVEQAKQLRLVVNLRTAQQLRLKIPPSVLIRADEVVE
jgi:putative tryptophan/tyrosine transport system substrate-binding protein